MFDVERFFEYFFRKFENFLSFFNQKLRSNWNSWKVLTAKNPLFFYANYRTRSWKQNLSQALLRKLNEKRSNLRFSPTFLKKKRQDWWLIITSDNLKGFEDCFYFILWLKLENNDHVTGRKRKESRRKKIIYDIDGWSDFGGRENRSNLVTTSPGQAAVKSLKTTCYPLNKNTVIFRLKLKFLLILIPKLRDRILSYYDIVEFIFSFPLRKIFRHRKC